VTATPPTLLLTRPEAQSRDLAGRLRARIQVDVPIVVSPILEIVPVQFDLPVDPAFLVLTSVHGAEAVAGRKAALAGLPAWCVGDRTAEAARAAGLSAISAGGTVEDLLALLLRERPKGPGVYLRGGHVAANLADALRTAGIDTHDVVVYDQAARSLSSEALASLARPRPVILPVYSPRSARLLAAATDGAAAVLEIVALSPQVAEAWPGPVTTVSAAPDGPTMEDAIVARLRACAAC
jgi:uroporphyrinogen-III synthase